MFKEIKLTDETFELLIKLYEAVGWVAYTEEPEELRKALDNSTYLYGFYEENELVGFIRGLTDFSSLNYVQDILVKPNLHNKGVGSKLLQFVKKTYDVRAQVLLTDDEPGQLAYYKKNGYKNTRDLKNIPLNCFVDFKGIDLD